MFRIAHPRVVGGLLLLVLAWAVFAFSQTLDAQETKSPSTGKTTEVKLPDDWPKDVPLYPGSKLRIVEKVLGGQHVAASTPDKLDMVFAYYDKEMKKQG